MTFRERYLAEDPDLMKLYAGSANIAGLEKCASLRSKVPVDRKRLVNVIRKQYDAPPPTAVAKNIDLLLLESAFTITTGQQVGLIGGPLYAIYKTISTIGLAKKAAEILATPVVPVFWMATEDHDADEVDHFFSDFNTRWRYTGHVTGPVGRHTFTSEIESFFDTAGVPEYGKWFRPGISWAEAFRSLWRELFDHEGLIVLDPDDPELKVAIRSLIRADLLQQAGFEGVSEATATLATLDLKGQVEARDPNFFILEDGQRKKVVRRSDQLLIGMEQQPVSMSALLQRLETTPEYFSPNVVLRPLYQESLLPNIAYVGGWAEIAYWGQFKGVFDRCGLPMPIIWPRMSASLISPAAVQQLQDLGFSPQDLDRSYDDLKFTLAGRRYGSPELHRNLEQILDEMARLALDLGKEHPTLERSINGWKIQSQHFFEHLERRRLKLLMMQDPLPFRQLASIKQHLKPDGKLQERFWSLAAIAPTDPASIVQQIMQKSNPLSPVHQWIIL